LGHPREVEFVAELPLTATGKIVRKALREREWGKKPQPDPAAAPAE
jgi:acetyl-CoA synthetase